MNAREFRRELVLAGIRHGHDLSVAVARAMACEGWIESAGDDGAAAPPALLALPAPCRAAETVPAAPREDGKPRRSRRARRAKPCTPRRAKKAAPKPRAAASVPAAAAVPSSPPPRAAPCDGLLARALEHAGERGASIDALVDAGVGSRVTVMRLLKRALRDGRVERLGPKRGPGVVWRRAAGGGGGAAASAPAAAKPPAAAPANGFDPDKVKNAVLFALRRGPGDAATLAAATYYPRDAVVAALDALALAGKVARGEGNAWKRIGT